MPVQTESSRVARIEKAIAELKGKAAKKRGEAAKKRQAAQKARESISRNTSASMAKQKMRTADKADEAAAKLEEEAANYEKQAANKGTSLANAQRSLSTAQRQETQKEEREAKNRRRDELRDLKRIETARRAAQSPEPLFVPHTVPEPTASPSPAGYPDPYDVALSFAGEQRAYVALVAEALESKKYRVFYDETEVLQTWGKELTELFDWVYRIGSRSCVMFISEDYERKEWTTLERRSALARALEEDEYVLPVRFDDTELAGVRPTVGYVSAADYAPNSLADLIAEKLGPPRNSGRD